MMHVLAQRSDVIPLALHVDYWDYIGWEDSFADPAFTTRQQGYARVAGARSIYTPQMVIGGQDHVTGAKPMAVADLIQAHNAMANGVQIALVRSGDKLQITGQSARAFSDGSVVQLVRFSPEETVDIRSGENAGRAFSYANVVTEWRSVGEWSGQDALDMTVNVSGDAPIVVIVQEPGPGAVMASAQLR